MITRPLLFVEVRVRRWQAVGFAVFCLLAGSRWLVESARPSAWPGLWAQATHFGVVGLAMWLVWRRGLPRGSWRIAVAGVLLLGFPAILNTVAGPWVDHAGAALFTLVPLFVVVGVAAVGSEGGSRALMMPALAGAAGGLLVLPFALPSTVYGAVLFGVVLGAVLSTAVGGIWLHRLMQGHAFVAGVVIVCVANAVLLSVAAGVLEGAPASHGLMGEGLRGLAVKLPMTLLLLWLVRAVDPVRLAARALLAPLVTVAEGMVLLRSGVDGRSWLGVGLMVVGAAALLWWRPVEGETGLGLG